MGLSRQLGSSERKVPIVIVGAGTVGAELVSKAADNYDAYCIRLIDIAPGLAEGVALDLRQ